MLKATEEGAMLGVRRVTMAGALALVVTTGLGLPLYAPVEIHVVGPQGFQKLTRRGKAVKLSG